MNKLTNKLLTILCMASLLSACDTSINPSVDDFEPSAGDADFSTFVTVGDSLTAGYRDGALFRDGQIDSFGAILAQQFWQVGGGVFEQPLRMPEFTGSFGPPVPSDGSPGSINDRLVLVATGNPERPVAPATITPTVSEPFPPTVVTGPFNNFGVPGAKSFHLSLANYGNLAAFPAAANPFFIRFADDPALSTVVGDAEDRGPTFFTLWIGNNDILLNAVEGSPGFGANPGEPVFGTGLTDVTPVGTFNMTYPTLVTTLTSTTGNKGVLMNVPDVRSIPYFTTVPYNALPLDSDTIADPAALAAGYNAYLDGITGIFINQAEADKRKLSFSVGQNAVIISDETLTDLSVVVPGFPPDPALTFLATARQATEDDLILLPVSSKLGEEGLVPGTVWGVTYPLEDGDVLIKEEADALEGARQAYNTTIETEANADDDLVLFDASSLLQQLNETGIVYGSGGVSSTFVQGGFFSLDGIHPSPRGNAVIANEIIKVINAGFNANVAPVDPNQFGTVDYQK